MNRLHLPQSELTSSTAVVRGDALTYLRDVLRLRVGSPIEVFDGEGHVHASTVLRLTDAEVVLELGPREERPFRGVRVKLLQGLPKGDKFELIVQKAVELGAVAIVPVITERSVVKLDQRKAAERVERWQRIADEAARQCERAETTAIEPVLSLQALLAAPPASTERRIVLDEEERSTRLRDTLGSPDRLYSFLIGPEGGLTRLEVAAAQRAGFTPVTLGPRILRTETVGLAVMAVLQHVLGDFG